MCLFLQKSYEQPKSRIAHYAPHPQRESAEREEIAVSPASHSMDVTDSLRPSRYTTVYYEAVPKFRFAVEPKIIYVIQSQKIALFFFMRTGTLFSRCRMLSDELFGKVLITFAYVLPYLIAAVKCQLAQRTAALIPCSRPSCGPSSVSSDRLCCSTEPCGI